MIPMKTSPMKQKVTAIRVPKCQPKTDPKVLHLCKYPWRLKCMHSRKKVDSNRKYKCSVCGISKSLMQQVNEHHLRNHKPNLPNLRPYVCSGFFTHMARLWPWRKKIPVRCMWLYVIFWKWIKGPQDHTQKNPAFQCMVKNCGKWFRRKWELTVHLKKLLFFFKSALCRVSLILSILCYPKRSFLTHIQLHRIPRVIWHYLKELQLLKKPVLRQMEQKL